MDLPTTPPSLDPKNPRSFRAVSPRIAHAALVGGALVMGALLLATARAVEAVPKYQGIQIEDLSVGKTDSTGTFRVRATLGEHPDTVWQRVIANVVARCQIRVATVTTMFRYTTPTGARVDAVDGYEVAYWRSEATPRDLPTCARLPRYRTADMGDSVRQAEHDARGAAARHTRRPGRRTRHDHEERQGRPR